MNLSGNKGEWGELYAFLRILADGEMLVGNERNALVAGESIHVVSLHRNDGGDRRVYTIDRENQSVTVLNLHEEFAFTSIPQAEFRDAASQVLSAINSKSGAFTVPSVETFLLRAKITRLQANGNRSTTDLLVRLQDRRTSREFDAGFSIKTTVGGSPTILNASKSTVFYFEVAGRALSQEDAWGYNAQPFSRHSLGKLVAGGHALEFRYIRSETFQGNLEMVDSLMPQIVADGLLSYYLQGMSGVSGAATVTARIPRYSGYQKRSADYLAHKWREFLAAASLGMTAAKKWNGRADADGGYIVVDPSGDVLAHYTARRDDFLDYLFDNAYFDTPSSARHDFGRLVYDGDGRWLIGLGLQIRFAEPGMVRR